MNLASVSSASVSGSLIDKVSPECGHGVEARIDRQQERIDQGVESGQLTFGEYSHLQTRLDKIDATYEKDMKENGGHLTPEERKSLEHRENNLSQAIYFNKHNLARQPGAPQV